MNFDYTADEIKGQQEFAHFCQQHLAPAAAEIDRASASQAQELMARNLRRLAESDYLGLNLSTGFMGRGMDLITSLPFHEAVAASCPATYISAQASSGMVGRLIDEAGSEEQKQLYLEAIIKGLALAAFAVHESDSGSNVFDMSAYAWKTEAGWVLQGEKTMITNAPAADIFVVLAITDHAAGEKGFSFFIVPRDTAGVTVSEPVPKMGLRGAAVGQVTFTDCQLPSGALLGELGQGYALYRSVSTEGQVRFASFAIGVSQACLKLALQFSLKHKTSGKPIFRNQDVSFKLADMQTMIDTSLQLTRSAAWMIDQGSAEAEVQASCAKLFASESATKIAHMAQQILGEYGYLQAHDIERFNRDVRYGEIGQGTSEQQRAFIAQEVFSKFGKEVKPPQIKQQRPSRRVVMPKRVTKKVAICAVAQTTYERDKWDQRFQGMALDVLESLLEQTGLDFSENGGINTSISVSDDVFDARTISDNAMTDVLGAHYRCEEKVAQEGAQAVYYGLATILSGHTDLVLIIGHCKESQPESRNMVSHMAFDPFYTRPVGLDFCSAAALQAQAYMAKSYLTDKQLAEIVVRARQNAARNPLTSSLKPVSVDDVLNSPLVADPIRELHMYPVSDGAVGLILASEERARQITETPVWITGAGNCFDSFFLGDRDLTSNFALKKAAERAYQRAGISDPLSAFDVVEISDQYAYQQPMWIEGLGLCEEGKGGKWLDQDGPATMKVNLSGGMLAGNPLILGGLIRVAEATLQLKGSAAYSRNSNPKRALAHGVMGPAGQFHTVVILEKD
ncbi:acyl-CoA dehydrogenase family protein [candidate division CSSED10-310 bacterium]|uniref:Acyl-CoA dehydrogenase family protein n=1 Tax=candidate division CSSED10-310 bacterium TaxID=2855610 RepID=A0ABV6YZJ6_UNCC1